MAKPSNIKKLISSSSVAVLVVLICIGPVKSQAQSGTLAADEGEASYFEILGEALSYPVEFPCLFFCWMILIFCFVDVGLAVEALREIAEQLNKKDWNFGDPCSNIPTFSSPHTDQYNNTLVCNCSFSGNVCHIESMYVPSTSHTFCVCLIHWRIEVHMWRALVGSLTNVILMFNNS